MVSSDTVVGIVGAVILTGAMIAVFYYENSTADERDGFIGEGGTFYTFAYEEDDDGLAQTVTLPVGGDQSVAFQLPAFVYEVHVEVTWGPSNDPLAGTPLAAGPAQVKAFLQTDAGEPAPEGPKEDRSGRIELHHGHGPEDEHTTPPQSEVRVAADSEDQARATLREATADAHGAGEWAVVLEYTGHEDSPVGEQRALPQEVTVTIHYRYWAPQLVE